MLPIQRLIEELTFRLTLVTPYDVLDIVMVTATFYLMFSLLRRSQAAFLVRGVLILLGLLFTTTVLIQLPTFNYLMLVSIIAVVIAIPITLQPELRHWMERIGRTTFLANSVHSDISERVIPNLLRAVENLSAAHTGALLVIEGTMPLDDVIATGVSMDARLSAELIQTIFFDKTALHDGAIVVRDDELVAAGCILPLTARELSTPGRRFGTRHRAAIGMSETGDALVIVVSEETGSVSVAHNGKFRSGLDSTQMRLEISSFYSDTEHASLPWMGIKWRRPSVKSLLSSIGYLIASAFLAVLLWLAVSASSNPILHEIMEGVPLTVVDVAPGRTLAQTPPSTVAVGFLTTEAQLPNLSADSFSAEASVSGLGSGKYRVPVTASSDAADVMLLADATVPGEIDVTITPIVTVTLPVVPIITDASTLSAAYMIVGEPGATPSTVDVVGPQTVVDQIANIVAPVSVAGATTSIRTDVAVQLLDVDGQPLARLSAIPPKVQVTVVIRQRLDAKDVGVRAVTTGTPPEGYWLSSLTTEPTGVTLQGDESVLATIGSFVDTLPVDISDAESEIRVQTPLDLPEGVTAIDSNGAPVNTVLVIVGVSERRGDISLTVPLTVINSAGYAVTVQPESVELLLSGSIPTLERIQANPALVMVTVNANGLLPGESRDETPVVTVPAGVTARLVTNMVIVTREPEP